MYYYHPVETHFLFLCKLFPWPDVGNPGGDVKSGRHGSSLVFKGLTGTTESRVEDESSISADGFLIWLAGRQGIQQQTVHEGRDMAGGYKTFCIFFSLFVCIHSSKRWILDTWDIDFQVRTE